ncbi:MAG TPA: thioredoxin domain-containing protein [Myxococcales bacterium LLY-WYZ-16_1]|nr:thioredoxin domain-containing protein [Myxococcales bacterium LLY-WYZ-16_1]
MRILFLGLFALSACTPSSSGAPGESAKGASESAASNRDAASEGRLPDDEVVATLEDRKITYGELAEAAQSELDKARTEYLQKVHSIERQKLDEMIVQHLIEKKAESEGMQPGEYMRSLSKGAKQPTEEEIESFYQERVAKSGQKLEDVRTRIVQYLSSQSQRSVVQKKLASLKEDASVKTSLPPPDLPKASFELEGRPFKGPKDAKVTVVEFSDFQCPYCSRAVPAVERLVKEFPEDVKVYFLHFPLSFHEQAMPAAMAAECAHRQGEFWPMHDKLFENQRALGDDKYAAWAEEIGLDKDAFASCMDDAAVKKRVQRDMAMGRQAGVSGTPTFYVNGVKSPSGPPSPNDIRPLL